MGCRRIERHHKAAVGSSQRPLTSDVSPRIGGERGGGSARKESEVQTHKSKTKNHELCFKRQKHPHGARRESELIKHVLEFEVCGERSRVRACWEMSRRIIMTIIVWFKSARYLCARRGPLIEVSIRGINFIMGPGHSCVS